MYANQPYRLYSCPFVVAKQLAFYDQPPMHANTRESTDSPSPPLFVSIRGFILKLGILANRDMVRL